MSSDAEPEIPGSNFPLLPQVINGSISGVVGTFCVSPIGLVKTRLQNQQPGPAGELMYKSLADCFRQTARNEGVLALWRGVTVDLVLITPEKVIKLVGNDFFRHHLASANGDLTLGQEMLAGSAAGASHMIVTTPRELLKIQLQDAGRTTASSGNAGKPAKITGTSVTLDLIRTRGFSGLYKGGITTTVRDIIFSGIYFPLFAKLNAMGKRRPGSDKAVFYHTFICGCLASSFASLIINPIDMVKTRLQTLHKGKGEQYYSGILDCFRKVYLTEGPLAFMNGGLSRIMVIAPLFGIAQTVYYLEAAEHLLGMQIH